MTETLSVGQVKRRIKGYFEDCRAADQPCTPAGLALALGIRTFELHSEWPAPQRALIDQALQRIEADTVELALSAKAGAKGVEAVFRHTDTQPEPDTPLQRLSDEELDERILSLIARIEELRNSPGSDFPFRGVPPDSPSPSSSAGDSL